MVDEHLEQTDSSDEQGKPLDNIMRDPLYWLMRQCFIDSGRLQNELPFKTARPKLAYHLFMARSANPVQVEHITQMLIAGYNAEAILKEVKSNYEELDHVNFEVDTKRQEYERVVKNCETLKSQIGDLEQRVVERRTELQGVEGEITEARQRAKAEGFLAATIGQDAVDRLRTKEYIDVLGTNNAIYRIRADGVVAKFTMNFRGKPTLKWRGRFRSSDLPFEDQVATIYAHIAEDSDKFDAEKGCGSITITDIGR